MGSDEARLSRDPFSHTRLPRLTGVPSTCVVAMYRNLPLAKSTVPNSGPLGPTLTTYTKGSALAEVANKKSASGAISACATTNDLDKRTVLTALNTDFMLSPLRFAFSEVR